MSWKYKNGWRCYMKLLDATRGVVSAAWYGFWIASLVGVPAGIAIAVLN